MAQEFVQEFDHFDTNTQPSDASPMLLTRRAAGADQEGDRNRTKQVKPNKPGPPLHAGLEQRKWMQCSLWISLEALCKLLLTLSLGFILRLHRLLRLPGGPRAAWKPEQVCTYSLFCFCFMDDTSISNTHLGTSHLLFLSVYVPPPPSSLAGGTKTAPWP